MSQPKLSKPLCAVNFLAIERLPDGNLGMMTCTKPRGHRGAHEAKIVTLSSDPADDKSVNVNITIYHDSEPGIKASRKLRQRAKPVPAIPDGRAELFADSPRIRAIIDKLDALPEKQPLDLLVTVGYFSISHKTQQRRMTISYLAHVVERVGNRLKIDRKAIDVTDENSPIWLNAGLYGIASIPFYWVVDFDTSGEKFAHEMRLLKTWTEQEQAAIAHHEDLTKPLLDRLNQNLEDLSRHYMDILDPTPEAQP